MKQFLPILFWLWPSIIFSQVKDSLITTPRVIKSQSPSTNTQFKPEILTSGFIDIINNGQVNASARFVRLYIGEPGKFAIPLSLYSGVSSNSFQNPTNIQRSNDVLVTNFINPLSGLANVSIDGVSFFNKKSQKTTKSGFLYHIGERILTGIRTGPSIRSGNW